MEKGRSWLVRKHKPRHPRHFREHSHWYLVTFFLSSSSLCWSVAALRASLLVYWLWQYSLISWRACLVLSDLKLRSTSLHRDFSSVIEFHRLHTLQERHRCYFSCMKKAKHRGSWFKRTDHWHKIKQLLCLRYDNGHLDIVNNDVHVHWLILLLDRVLVGLETEPDIV